MSRWKHKSVTIIQAFQGTYYSSWFGLGDDQKLYKWDRDEGAWEKLWLDKDVPV